MAHANATAETKKDQNEKNLNLDRKAIRIDRAMLRTAYRMDETDAVERLLGFVELTATEKERVSKKAQELVEGVRSKPVKLIGIENFLSEFGLTTPEGIALMCMAEALLRVPDTDTANKLIKDKITSAHWDEHVGKADDIVMNLSSWALMLSGKVMKGGKSADGMDKLEESSVLGGMVKRLGEPVIRQAMLQAMKILGRQFVMGQTIEEALRRAAELEGKGFRYSYDMLGEGARTKADAKRYFDTYATAIDVIGQAAQKAGSTVTPFNAPGISVKLSALHPRYSQLHADTCVPELANMLKTLAMRCKYYNIGLTVDAEEANRLEPSLDIIETVFSDPDLEGWEGFGLAVQAYQKRAFYLIDWLADLARSQKRRLMVRLVKGAYWDSEIKWTQEAGLETYPVFTRKASTDLSYMACAIKLLRNRDVFYPQLATHNAHTVATVITMAGDKGDYEFQRLHGMGEPLYEQVVGEAKIPCRIYAPVGTHQDLLPYLVRRLLENGANSSFVNRIQDPKVPIEEMIADPRDYVERLPAKPHPKIPLPRDILEKGRANSKGLELAHPDRAAQLTEVMAKHAAEIFMAAPIISGEVLEKQGPVREVRSPANHGRLIGHVTLAEEETLEHALHAAHHAFPKWDRTPVEERAACLERMADLLEENRERFMTLCALEAGKTLQDGIDEVREAVDFCRYYAMNARRDFGAPVQLPGPTGEKNLLSMHGRGVFLCISPWNFPLAIFLGQVTAALAAGNSVLAKAADQTNIIAYEAVKLLHKAGISRDVLHFVPARGSVIGKKLIPDPRIAGIVFTGSTETAKIIQRTLAERDGAIIPFIAETGGQNAMIVDSTALPEQVVDTVIRSAFLSAGQRCSALRVLFLQEEIADKVIEMLKGAMDCLVMGDPMKLATDVGPVIDQKALDGLNAHREAMRVKAEILHEMRMGEGTRNGTFCAPTMIAIESINVLEQEHFGPLLHIVRYKGKDLSKVIDQINATGYGLTLGIHTRIDFAAHEIAARVRVGNTYVNRGMTGAVVGVQPFGGEGLSGTGPKAGGPRYLHRFGVERCVSIDTTAAGGNASLVSLAEE